MFTRFSLKPNFVTTINLIIYNVNVALLSAPRWRNGHAIACRAIPIQFDSGPWLIFLFFLLNKSLISLS